MRKVLPLIIVIALLLMASPVMGESPPGVEPGAWTKVEAQLEVNGVHRQTKAGRDVPTEVAKLLPRPDLASEDANFGRAVAIDGTTIVVGVIDDDQAASAGAAYIFCRDQGGAGAWGQVAKLTAPDGADFDDFGYSVAISLDTVVVGAHYDDDDVWSLGSAYVFRRNQGGSDAWGWVAKLTAPDGEEYDYFGDSVGISGDTVVVGAHGNSSNAWASGSAYIFQRDQGGADVWGWVAKLTAPDGEHNDWFGLHAGISGDTVVVGSYRDDDNGSDSGSAYIFQRDQGGADVWGWVAKLTASDGSEGDIFGSSVGISGDTVVVGAPGDNDNGSYSGSAYIFARDEGGADAWGEVTKIAALDGASGDYFGFAVGVSDDIVVVGAYRDLVDGVNSSGSVYIFQRDEGGFDAWGEAAKITGPAAGGHFGRTVGIKADTLLVGAPNYPDRDWDSGFIFIFSRNEGGAGAWGQVAEQEAPDAMTARYDQFGFSVAMSVDTVVVGASGDDDNGVDSGSAYIFGRDVGGADAWGLVAKITALDNWSADSFGEAVAISGGTVVVGAIGGDENGDYSGSAYIFGRDVGGADNWGEVAKIFASDGAAGDYFGHPIAISGDTVVAGAWADDDNGSDSGSAFVFSRDEGGVDAWGEVAKLTASDGASEDYFGFWGGISGDTVVIGASGDDDNGVNSGSAYIFGRDVGGADNWGEIDKITASDGRQYDAFGYSVAISGDTVVVGAYGDDDNGSISGSAYIFSRNQGGAWGEVVKFSASDGAMDDSFAKSVGIRGDTVIAGAYLDDDLGPDSGSTYLFRRVVPSPSVHSVETTPAAPGGGLSVHQWVSIGITDFQVSFTLPLFDPPGNTEPDDCTNAVNWLLVEAGADDVVQTTSCSAGVAGDDQALALDGFATGQDPMMHVTFRGNGGAAVPDGRYTLFACGTLQSTQGGALDGDFDGTGGDDYVLPFQVDTEPPTVPSNLATTTHDTPSPATVIETNWTASSDSFSGVGGYAWDFTGSDTWTCDEVIDGDRTTTASEPLIEGQWWFHICASDAVGNWSDVVSLGPMVVEVTVPEVVAIGAEGSTADGLLMDSESALAAISQLMINFSETISNPAGDGTIGDLTNPDHYRVLDLGADGVLSTVDCTSALDGDDADISLSGLTPWTGDQTVSVAFGLPTGLPTGRFTLMLCSLQDLNGNEMASPWTRAFSVEATNLLLDPNFDDPTMSDWDTDSPNAFDIQWRPEDPSSETSGIAVIDTVTGSGDTYELTQCLEVTEGTPFGLAAISMIDSTEGDAPTLKTTVRFFRNVGCTDLLETIDAIVAQGDSAGAWGPRVYLSSRAPEGALSAKVGFVVEAGLADEFSLYLDETAFFQDLLFVDGFETGNMNWWSASQP